MDYFVFSYFVIRLLTPKSVIGILYAYSYGFCHTMTQDTVRRGALCEWTLSHIALQSAAVISLCHTNKTLMLNDMLQCVNGP